MSLGRIVPWTNWNDWFKVKKYLTRGRPSADETEYILDIVKGWRARGRVPLAVDLTACFVETQLMEQQGGVPEILLRMQYSMAVVRLVNGITDSSQKGRVAASVASLSAAAGLPRLLVDLRHEATHNELPSLPALQLAAKEALAWLHVHYWERQDNNIAKSSCEINKLLGDYVASHVAAAKKAAAAILPRQDSEEEEEGGPRKVASAVAGEEEYNVAAARKLRQTLLTELRVSVPRPLPSLMTSGLIEAQKAASADTPAEVVERALSHALKHLYEGWPQLRILLLNEVARGLEWFCGRLKKNPADYVLWAQVLSPKEGEKLSEMAAMGLLETVVASWYGRCFTLGSHSEDLTVSAIEIEREEHEGIKAFVDLACRYIDSEKVKCRVQELWVDYNCYKIDIYQALVGETIHGDDDARRRALEKLKDFREKLRQFKNELLECAMPGKNRPQTDRKNGEVEQRALDGHDEEGNGNRIGNSIGKSSGGHRWKRRKIWTPCAIGMLPDATDPNGAAKPRLVIENSWITNPLGITFPSHGAVEGAERHGAQDPQAHRFDKRVMNVEGTKGEGADTERLAMSCMLKQSQEEDVSEETEPSEDVAVKVVGRCPPPAAGLSFL